jgi:hypothetical protein
MSTFHKLTIAAALAITSMAYAQTPAEQAQHHPAAATGAAAATDNRMAMMNTHMKAMCDLHAKFKRARTPAQRDALMAEHMKLMREGMAMHGGSPDMQGMHGMHGMHGGMQGMHGGDAAPGGGMAAGMAAHRETMEKRMETMQSMMQTILDRLPPAPAKP